MEPMIRLSENFRALFYAPFYAAHATGAFTEAGVEVELVALAQPAGAVKALRAGEVDVMWGGPLRVMMTARQRPAADLVCFCDVVARDPFFIIGAKPRPDFRFADLQGLRFATVSEVPTPWICLADDLRRAGVDPVALDRIADRTMEENEAALRAGTLDAVHLFQPYAERLIASGAGHLWYAARRRAASPPTPRWSPAAACSSSAHDELLTMTRAVHRTLGWFAARRRPRSPARCTTISRTSRRAIFAGAIERYRALGLWGADPVIRREGYDRLHAAMRAAGALRRDIAFDDCVDTSLAKQRHSLT